MRRIPAVLLVCLGSGLLLATCSSGEPVEGLDAAESAGLDAGSQAPGSDAAADLDAAGSPPGLDASVPAGADAATPPPGPDAAAPLADAGASLPPTTRVIYLHHSTGGVIWNGGVPQALTAYNAAHGTSYAIEELAYPKSPYPWANYPYDYWHLWVEDGGQAAAEGIPWRPRLHRGSDP